MRTLTFIALSAIIFTACQATGLSLAYDPTTIKREVEQNNKVTKITIPKSTKQLIKVTTKDWNSKDGELQRYEKDKNGNWIKVGESIKIVLGRNGLAWGLGLHDIPVDAKYIKKEGDGRSPAGLFELGNGFGYKNFKINFPYEKYKRTDHCVDDSHSKYYNTIIDSTKVKKDYKSFEHMRLRNNLYKYGITVKHNPLNIPQSGSCIFMHIKNKRGTGTAGCTAMSQKSIITILKWLDKEKSPLLLQLPKSEID
jgi:D-alanyl-D-alanine dipeptidase